MDIHIALFLGFLSLTFLFFVMGIVRRAPYMLVFTGLFIFFISVMTDNIIMGYRDAGESAVLNSTHTDTDSRTVCTGVNQLVCTVSITNSTSHTDYDYFFLSGTESAILYPFTDMPKVIFAVFGSVLMLVGALVYLRD